VIESTVLSTRWVGLGCVCGISFQRVA